LLQDLPLKTPTPLRVIFLSSSTPQQCDEWFYTATTVLLFGLLVNAFIKKQGLWWYSPKNKQSNFTNMEQTITIPVKGMTCNHCKANVEKHTMQIPGVTKT
jgi:hypothetical protein